MNFHFKVGNDNGNSEHDIYIDGELFSQPNVNVIVDKLPLVDSDTSIEFLVRNLIKNLVVTINSPACKPRMYKVGEFALVGTDSVNYLQVGVDKKFDVDLPVVNTLAIISAHAVKKAFEKTKELPEKIIITVDMATALPVTQWSDEAAAKFQKKFMDGKHFVTVHLGYHRIDVEIKFEYVKVIPEGTPVVFALQVLPLDGFDEFNRLYNVNIDGSYFSDKRILHVDIGDGTTEYPITEGFRFLRQYMDGAGSENGAGHAIEKALPDFRKRSNLLDVPRQYMEEVLKESDPYKKRYYKIAKEVISVYLENQAMQINKKVIDQINNIKNEIDIICCYGGGSILMREFLFDKLKNLADERMVQLFYIPAKYAVIMNALGLNEFVRSDIFKAIKENALKVS